MSTRLPIPNSDDGTWGNILNAYLEISHNDDGSLKTAAVQTAGGVTSVNGKSPAGGAVSLSVGDLSNASAAGGAADSQVLSYHAATGQWVPATVSSSTVNNATSSTPGLITLSGDLGGTATTPKVTGINGVAVAAGTPTTNQVLAYNGSQWQNATLTESDVTNLASDLSTLTSNVSAKYTKPVGGIPATDLTSSVQSSLTAAGSAVQIGGDLGGTAASPAVMKLRGTAISAPSGGSTAYLNAAGTWTVPAGGGESSVLDWVSVTAHGADPTGAADSSAAFTAAIAALPATGGVIYAPAGTYKLATTITFHERQGLIGDGHATTNLVYTGNGTCIHAIQTYPSGSFDNSAEGGVFQDFSLGGYGAGAAAIGIEVTDLQGTTGRDIEIYGFGGAGLGHNKGSGWSEEGRWTKILLVENGIDALFDGTSFDYGTYDFTIVTAPGAGGVVLRNGVNMNGCTLIIKGDFYAGNGSNNAAVLAIEPAAGNSGTSYLTNSHVLISVESSVQSGNSNPIGHWSVLMGSSNSASQFAGCTGVLSFYPASCAFQGFSDANFVPFGFSGAINDGAGRNMAAGDGLAIWGGTALTPSNSSFTPLYNDGTHSNVYEQFADIQAFRLVSGTNSLAFNAEGSGYCRRVDMYIMQPVSGAAGTVTWPANVKFPGGTKPVLSSTNGYVDHVRLVYIPATSSWYGELVGAHYA